MTKGQGVTEIFHVLVAWVCTSICLLLNPLVQSVCGV